MRFMILILLLATCAGAAPVDPYAEDGIASIHEDYCLCTSGEVWMYDRTVVAWIHVEGKDVPIPLQDIKDWSTFELWTHDGHHWEVGYGIGGDWVMTSPVVPCFTPIENQEDTFGSVKQMYR